MNRLVHFHAGQSEGAKIDSWFGVPPPQPWPEAPDHPATIALVAKFKPAKGKKTHPVAPQGAIPCVILVIAGMILVMLFLYFVMRNANG